MGSEVHLWFFFLIFNILCRGVAVLAQRGRQFSG